MKLLRKSALVRLCDELTAMMRAAGNIERDERFRVPLPDRVCAVDGAACRA